jgi:hypothetical protein
VAWIRIFSGTRPSEREHCRHASVSPGDDRRGDPCQCDPEIFFAAADRRQGVADGQFGMTSINRCAIRLPNTPGNTNRDRGIDHDADFMKAVEADIRRLMVTSVMKSSNDRPRPKTR